jgi:PAS domain S-box-containing protein
VAGIAWILLSDRAVGLLTTEPEAVARFQQWKGLFFVIATAGLILWLVQRGLAGLARAHEQIAARERYFRSLYEKAPTAYQSLDEQGRLLDVNEAWLGLLGWEDRGEVLGRPVADFLEPSQLALLEERFPEFKATGRLEDAEFVLRRRDGAPVTVTVVGRAQHDTRGRFVSTHCVLHDITERKAAEQALRESERRLSLALDGARLGTFAWDPDDGSVRWDQRQAELYGTTLDDFAGTQADVFARMHPEDLPRVKDALARAQVDRSLLIVEYRAVWPDGSEHWLSAAGRYQFDERGRAVFLRGVTMDVDSRKRAETERDQLEAQLRQAQKMEAVGQLAGGVAHDFNNLLQVINGYSEMVLDDLPADHPSRRFLEEVASAGGRAARLVGQLLAFSRRQVLEPEQLDLDDVVGDLLGMAQRTLGEHIRVVWRPAGDLGPVTADRGQLEQVLMNLWINARDAMPGGGELMITTAATLLDAAYCRRHALARPGPYVSLTIGDTGTGMDPAVVDRIWEPFFTTKPPGKGTGLGLSTVYGIVRQHGGMIHLDSEPGRGTTFTILLPEAASPAAAGSEDEPPGTGTPARSGT